MAGSHTAAGVLVPDLIICLTLQTMELYTLSALPEGPLLSLEEGIAWVLVGEQVRRRLGLAAGRPDQPVGLPL